MAHSLGVWPTVSSRMSGDSGDLVGRVDPGELADLAVAGTAVETLWVTPLGDLQRRVHVGLEELARARTAPAPARGRCGTARSVRRSRSSRCGSSGARPRPRDGRSRRDPRLRSPGHCRGPARRSSPSIMPTITAAAAQLHLELARDRRLAGAGRSRSARPRPVADARRSVHGRTNRPQRRRRGGLQLLGMPCLSARTLAETRLRLVRGRYSPAHQDLAVRATPSRSAG